MAQRMRRVLALIGPYPYNPYLLFLFFFAVQFCRLASLIVEQPRGPERYEAAFLIALISLPPALIFAAAGSFLNKYRLWSKKSLLFYILEVSAVQSAVFIYSPLTTRFVKKRFNYDYHSLLDVTPELFLGTLSFALVSLALMHQAELKIRNRLEAADRLVEQLRADREELIGADEQVREQTSRFLHDRVQSDLMVVGMKLKSISGQSSTEINEVIETALTRLEKTRTNDLRDLVQILTPNFETGGIKEALRVLAVQYQDSMKIASEIEDKSEDFSSKELLGVFRIIEQSLINSLMHGPATQVLISLKTNESGVSELSVSDNGPGINLADVTSGTGTAIIDSWVGILNGKKTDDTVPGHGYRLVVNFPA